MPTEQEINALYQARERSPIGHSRRWGTDIDYWSSDLIRDPGDYVGRHRDTDEDGLLRPGTLFMVHSRWSGDWFLSPF